MFVAFLLAAAAVQAAELSPPSIRAVPVAPAPPIVMTPVAPPAIGSYQRSTVTISVRATLGGTVLLEDRFRVGQAPATFMLSRSEATVNDCKNSWQGLRSHINFSLRPDGIERDNRYRLSFNWNRPNGACETDGIRGVSVEQPVVLGPGERTIVEGDGGLRIELRRL